MAHVHIELVALITLAVRIATVWAGNLSLWRGVSFPYWPDTLSARLAPASAHQIFAQLLLLLSRQRAPAVRLVLGDILQQLLRVAVLREIGSAAKHFAFCNFFFVRIEEGS